MIDSVHFEKFKSLEHVTLELGRLTALVGPNGSGKSSVLEGIHLLSQAGVVRAAERTWHYSRFSRIFGGARSPKRLISALPGVIKLEMGEANGDTLALSVALPGLNGDVGAPGLEFNVALAGPSGPLDTTVRWNVEANEFAVLDDARLKHFASAVYLHLDARKAAKSSIPTRERPRMKFDGSGLASTLAWMKGEAEDELAAVTSDLASVVPGVKRITTPRERVMRRTAETLTIDGQRIRRSVDERVMGDRFEIEFDDGRTIPGDLLSEGTVLALALITKLREPNRPRLLVLLDDVDRGLHIEGQAKLVEVLRRLLELKPGLQIVCTTHSPYLLDRFQPSEVRVLALDERRHTRAVPLTKHPEFEKWRFGTQTGELWAALGSAWPIGAARPQP